MRRTVLLMVSIALGVLFVSGVALAVTKTCSSSPCYGTKHNDALTEQRAVNDKIYGLQGDDIIRAGLVPRENFAEGPDTDFLRGGRGSDRLKSDDLEGRDVLYGGRGHDVCRIDSGDSTQGCEKAKRVSFPA